MDHGVVLYFNGNGYISYVPCHKTPEAFVMRSRECNPRYGYEKAVPTLEESAVNYRG